MAVKKRAATKTRKPKKRGAPTAATLKRRAKRAALKNRVKNAVNKVVRTKPKASASKIAAKKRANAARSKALKQAYATAQTKRKSIKVVKKNGATARSKPVKKPTKSRKK